MGVFLRRTDVKIASDLTDFTFRKPIDLIYFDAFSPEAQPELWCEEIFTRIVATCRSGAVLATYCAKGEIRRRLTRAGFHMERLPGPPGKREILRGTYYLEDGGDSL
ncbi:MnmC family methyltransferase [Porphyromonas gingivalis]|uniref:MnmC family methyltransferase n=1 Tax=Porphyromonas gingivalis TaxID=837 RepID=UPI00374D5A8D